MENKELDGAFKKAACGIDEIPELTSLLYDLDLMPEQIVSEAAKLTMILIVEHFRAFRDRVTSEK